VRILIANRGEIARRIVRTAHRLGHQTVAAWAEPDRRAPWVAEASMATRLGPAALAESYLSVDAVLRAAERSGADAVHPGYGFLAERADLARRVRAAGLTWIGPHPDAIESMGSKIEARRLAVAVGVAVIDGFDESQDPVELTAAADRIGYPVLVKASAGGGGKGIRVAARPEDFEEALMAARAEAERAFGDRSVIVERLIGRPRHVEVQVLGDHHGRVIELGTRECSLQRRYQKLVEEAPAPHLDPATDEGLRRSAVLLAEAIGYDSIGTVEFVVDDATGKHHFLEMNTRLQVEHPVTEAVTGLDLVELQLAVAQGRALPLTQDQVAVRGHALEARINAEDPWAGSTPQVGTIEALRVPAGVRWDTAVEPGSVVTAHYDPLIAKLIVQASDRDTARMGLVAALDGLVVAGVGTNAGFLRWLLDRPEVVAGRVTTRFVDDVGLPERPSPADMASPAAVAWQRCRDAERVRAPHAWARIGPLRLTPHRPRRVVTLVDGGGEEHVVDLAAVEAEPGPAVAVDLRRRVVAVNRAGVTETFRVPPRRERWRAGAGRPGPPAAALVAPFPAVVVEVAVGPGDEVHDGEAVVVLEAMKMWHTLVATGPGTVAAVGVRAGDQVTGGQVLVSFEEAT
jgi:acetyl/propionyl-CoA carboxylase alpha subunit